MALKPEVMSQNTSTFKNSFATIKATQDILWQWHELLLPSPKKSTTQSSNELTSSIQPSHPLSQCFPSLLTTTIAFFHYGTKASISVPARRGTTILASCAASDNRLCSISLTQNFALSTLLKI